MFALLASALLLSGCTSSSSDDDDDDAAQSNDIPDYTLQSESPADCAVEEADGTDLTVTADASCHVHLVFTESNEPVADERVRMTVEGEFLASRVYPLFFATNTEASDGWVVQIERNSSTSEVEGSICDGESCASPVTMSGSLPGPYNVGDTFLFIVDVLSGASIDEFFMWLETTPDGNPSGDLSGSNSPPMAGNVTGLSIQGAKITAVSIEVP
jgi:hypothetical protein